MAADPRFHAFAGPQSLAAVLAACGARSEGDGARMFDGIASLADAGPGEIGYAETLKHAGTLSSVSAGAVIVRPGLAGSLPPGSIAIISDLPALAFAAVAGLFHPAPRATGRQHPTAAIAEDAEVAPDVDIGAFAVIGARARLGPGCIIHPHAAIGPDVVLGSGCTLHSHATISHALCGDDVTLHPGARVGQEGFGFTHTAKGAFVTMPQLGRVLLGDRVEVGANACIDRGALGDTVIGAGSRIDNLVQVAHNVQLGQGCVLVALVGVSGSTVLEERVVMAGQAGVAGHLRIGAGARIGAQAGVMKSVPPGADMLGAPAQPIRDMLREWAMLRRLAARPQKGNKAARQEGDQEPRE